MLPSRAIIPTSRVLYFALAILAIGIGAVAMQQQGLLVIIGATVLFCIFLLSTKWRVATFAFLLFLPFAALPGLVLRQAGWTSLLKEGLFLAPAYFGVLLASRRQGLRWSLPTGLTIGLVALVLLVLIQSLPAALGSIPLALIGLKTWLLYLPLILLPQHLFRGGDNLARWIRVLVVVALIPCSIGIAEAILIYVGASSLVYNFYGSLASAATQDFAVVGLGEDLGVRRIPSTFAFVTQYYGFLLSMLPLAISLWLGDRNPRWAAFGGIATLIISIAGISSGARGFLIWLPIQVGLIMWLTGRRWLLLMLSGAVITGAVLLGSLFSSVFEGISFLSRHYLLDTTATEMQTAIQSAGWFGSGAGTQTGAIRYVLDQGPGIGVEGWYAKALFELGLGGLLIIIGLWTLILLELWRARRDLKSERFSVLASAIFVFAFTTMVNLIKAPMIDLDPQNIYFWFIVGLGLALPKLSSRGHRHTDADAGRAWPEFRLAHTHMGVSSPL